MTKGARTRFPRSANRPLDSVRRPGSAMRLFLGLALAAGLQACGGGEGSPAAPSTPAVSQPVTQNLPAQPFVGVAPGAPSFFPLTINGTGTATATLNWTFAANDLDIYVTSSTCSATTFAQVAACTPIAATTSTTAKPETVTFNVTPQTYRIWVLNFGPGSESGTLAVTTVTR